MFQNAVKVGDITDTARTNQPCYGRLHVGKDGDFLSGASVQLVKKRYSFGRAEDCDFRVSSQTVSRQHAVLVVEPEKNDQHFKVILRNLSKNGNTRIDGKRIKEEAVADGVKIFIGDRVFTFHAATKASKCTKVASAKKVVEARRDFSTKHETLSEGQARRCEVASAESGHNVKVAASKVVGIAELDSGNKRKPSPNETEAPEKATGSRPLKARRKGTAEENSALLGDPLVKEALTEKWWHSNPVEGDEQEKFTELPTKLIEAMQGSHVVALYEKDKLCKENMGLYHAVIVEVEKTQVRVEWCDAKAQSESVRTVHHTIGLNRRNPGQGLILIHKGWLKFVDSLSAAA